METNGWTVNLDGWTTMKPVLEWTDAAKGGDLGRLRGMMAEIIVAWPFEGDPQTEAGYDNLTPAQFKEAMLEAGKHVGNLFRG